MAGRQLWPLTARAQQGERMRRCGALMSVAEGNSEGQSWVAGSCSGSTR
jgi:hypothetical protein